MDNPVQNTILVAVHGLFDRNRCMGHDDLPRVANCENKKTGHPGSFTLIKAFDEEKFQISKYKIQINQKSKRKKLFTSVISELSNCNLGFICDLIFVI